MSRKKTLEDKIADLELGLNDWLEPLREWLKGAQEELSCLLVPKVGVEPTRGCPHSILSAACMPISPLRQKNLI